MNANQIKVGERYAFGRYLRRSSVVLRSSIERLTAIEFDQVVDAFLIAEVVEKGVTVPGYSNKGVSVRLFDPETGKPIRANRRWVTSGEEPDEWVEPVRTSTIIMPWEKWETARANRIDVEARASEEAHVKRQQKLAAQYEQSQANWRERVFGAARRDITEVSEVLGYELPDSIDERVALLVEFRYPAGCTVKPPHGLELPDA